MDVEVPFHKTLEILKHIFPTDTLPMSVDTLKQTNRKFAKHADSFQKKKTEEIRQKLEDLSPEEEACMEDAYFVETADGKGIPMKHKRDNARAEDVQKNKGPKPDRKRIAVVASTYVVSPHPRTPQEVFEALFRETPSNKEDKVKRPKPFFKNVTANLTRKIHDDDGKEKEINATDATFDWLREQKKTFSEYVSTPPIFLMDGQRSLWCKVEKEMGEQDRIEILDLMHAISYLWNIGHVFFRQQLPRAVGIYESTRTKNLARRDKRRVAWCTTNGH